MSASPAGKLYTPNLLSLSTQLAQFPLHEGLQLRSEQRSRTCGSTIDLGVSLDSNDRISAIGMQVSACAIGQASAAIMALEAVGQPVSNASMIEASINAWLAGEGEIPDWPGFDALSPALPHTGRHGALILPWKALARALFNVKQAS